MLLHRSEDVSLIEARATTKRVARTFAIACRLLPRGLRDDVYRLYLVFRTLDDLVDNGDARAPQRIAAVESWCAGRGRAARARCSCSPTSSAGTRCRATRSPTSAPACATTWSGRRSRRRPISTSTATASPARSAWSCRRCSAHPIRPRPCTPRRSARRCSARTSCATSTRTSRPGASISRARRSIDSASRAPTTVRARGAAARPDRARRRALRARLRGHPTAAPRPSRDRRGGRDVPRDPAPDRTRRLPRPCGRAIVSRKRKLLVAARTPFARAGAAQRET